MQWTPELVIALITAAGALFTTVMGAAFSKNVVDAIIRFADWWREGRERRRREHREEQERKLQQELLDEELNDKGHKFIIRRQDRRITELEAEVASARHDHQQCREDYVALGTRYAALDDQCKTLLERVSILEKRGSAT